jgi:beta-fructofuranosidase
MALRIRDKWIWDFWFARTGEQVHLFYLQAPRSLGDPHLRHHNASVGHATSRDLKVWHVLPDALAPGPNGSWDDLAIWTGSVIERDGRWHMLYTGTNRSEGGLIQRIGLAVSNDLDRWHKHPDNPVLEADGRWYELLDLDRWRDQSWRDPWLFEDPSDGTVRALITARYRDGAPDGAGVIAHARSHDLTTWEVLPPLTQPGDFAQVECPQLVSDESGQRILFSCLAEDHSAARIARIGRAGVTGTFVFHAATLDGPFIPTTDPIARPELGPLYAGRLVPDELGEWQFLAFRGAGDHHFVGELTDPLPVRLDPSGAIQALLATPSPIG